MNRIADLRPGLRTMEEAEACLAGIARAECEIACSAASCDRQIQTAKERHAERTARFVVERDGLVEDLTTFISTHRDLFKRPRKRTTEFGSFGLQTAAEIEIPDTEILIDNLAELGYDDCLKVVRIPIKEGLRKRLKAGETISGCALREGDTAVYKVAPSLLEEARGKVADL